MTPTNGAPASPGPQSVPAPAAGVSGWRLERTFEDMTAHRIRLILAGREWVLPVQDIGTSEDWWAALDARYRLILADIPSDDLPRMMTAVMSLGTDTLLGFLYDYDKAGVLPRDADGQPDPDFRRSVYPYELLPAVWEVSLAANPSGDSAVTTAVETIRALGRRDGKRRSADTRPSLRSMAGRLGRSDRT